MSSSHGPLRGAIIGCGFFGKIQIEAWSRIPEACIVAACDLDLERARRSAPAAYASPEEMLAGEQLDFVDIATRPESHLSLVRLAAEHGLAVICQKPMAPTWPEAVSMADAAEEARVRLMIHENWRWQPWYRAAWRIIEAGEIGNPIAYSFCTRRCDGGGPAPYESQPYFKDMPRFIIYETLVHHIDTARFLFGEIDTVFAHARRVNPAIAGEDRALLILAHRDSIEGVIDGHRFLDAAPDSPVMGDAFFEGDRGRIVVLPSGDVCLDGRTVWKNDVTAGYRGDSVAATQRHFVECLKSGRPFETGAREYLSTVAAVEAAYKSVAERRAVALTEFI